ncbi:MAG: hypothetical protein K1X66_05400 [Verrucomicrobiae bacterium]|nr:hypothetical protein [Verrucomicrobiae bacterium]
MKRSPSQSASLATEKAEAEQAQSNNGSSLPVTNRSLPATHSSGTEQTSFPSPVQTGAVALNQPQATKLEVIRPTMPKGGGAIKGMGETFQPNEFSGTGALSIPFAVSPGRGLAPSLSVNYSSGSGNSPFGLGFSLALPEISRQTAKGIPKYNDSDTFLFSGADYLVPHLTQPDRTKTLNKVPYTVKTYRPRTEGSFAKMEHWQAKEDSFWKVVAADNVTHIFGKTQNARISDPENPKRIFKWLIEETYNAHGDHVIYHYKSEDGQNIPNSVSEQNRTQTAQKYIANIQYGPTEPIPGSILLSQQPQLDPNRWHFEVVFDYGQYNIKPENQNPYTPVQTWSSRQDSFSTYDAGFEIRTHRLCHNLLMFHRFEKEFGDKPILTQALSFTYQQSPAFTQLQQVTQTGYQFHRNKPYQTQNLPPLEVGYTPFQPRGHRYEIFFQENHQALPGVTQPQPYQLIDLYGEGIPGILYGNGASLYYWEALQPPEPEKAARYTLPKPLPSFPIERQTESPVHTLTDFTGDGQLDLLVTTPTRAGYYTLHSDKTWSSFQPLESFPTDYHQHRSVDLTGDGLVDLIRIEHNRVRFYPAQRRKGFGAAQFEAREETLPLSRPDSPKETLRFADMAGTGHAQLVRINQGSVTYWPSLGYGKFGKPITMEHAPRFEADFDTTRLFLADIDGSGTTDLIYLHADSVEIFFNQSGNRFSDPIQIPLPEKWDHTSQIQFADVHGNGTTCLVFSKPNPSQRQWYYDFCQRQKPYLLNLINNNLGSQTRLHYASSTQFYLQDKQAGRPWVTNLPFPVQVIEKVEYLDFISKTRLTSSYSYHHGYYDGEEREFRGFGRVDRQDAETYDEASKQTAQLEDSTQSFALNTFTAPSFTKTWYHTGAWFPDKTLREHYQHEFFQGDLQAKPFPTTTIDYGQETPDLATQREAHRALEGAVLRTELYGLDNSSLRDNPYSVAETQHHVKLLQKRAANKYAVFLTQPQETIAYDYERNPQDPRIAQDFVLETDSYGHVTRACHLVYGRRKAGISEQTTLKAFCETADYINQTDAQCHLLGAPKQNKSYELKGLIPDQGNYFSFAGLKTQVEQQLSKAELLGWARHYYYDPRTGEELELGKITPEALLARSEAVEADIKETETIFEKIFSAEELEKLLTSKKSDCGGYVRYPTDPVAKKYYWNPGSSQIYHKAAQFYLPKTFRDPFDHETQYDYDAYHLLVKKVTDPVGNQSEITQINYQLLAPQQIKDPNGNCAEVRFDPLGQVIVTSHYGKEGGKRVGFKALDDYNFPSDTTLESILKNPEKYLQGAASFFYYNPFSWMKNQIPVHALTLGAEHYPDEPQASERIQISLAYSDGFGRGLQSKVKVREQKTEIASPTPSSENSERWLTSGAVRYNNKGNLIKQYEPFFSDTPHYNPNELLQKVGLSSTFYYDPLDRHILTQTPKTFLIKTLFGEWKEENFISSAWTQLHYDENQTIKDSTYYKEVMSGTRKVPKHEKESLEKAALFHNTFTKQIQDNLGRTIQVDQILIVSDPKKPSTISHYVELDITGQELSSADHRLHDQKKKNFQTTYTLSGQAIKTVSADAGTHWRLQNAVGNPLFSRDSRAFETRHNYDALHRPTTLHIKGGEPKLDQIVEHILYGDTALQTPEKWNARGKAIAHLDQAGLSVSAHYTIHDQPLASATVLKKDYKQEANWNSIEEAALKALAQAIEKISEPSQLDKLNLPDALKKLLEPELFINQASYDALGRVKTATDPGGNITKPSYYSTGWLEKVEIISKRSSETPSVSKITYDAKGQRTAIHYGNGTQTTYRYEPETFRLTQLKTTRQKNPTSSSSKEEMLQDIGYFYDPVGNITHITDKTKPTVFCNGQQVDPECDYTYDSLYRLIQATGREHPGMWKKDQRQQDDQDAYSFDTLEKSSLNDQLKLQNYTQTFTYDTGGNLTRMRHQATKSSASWTRTLTLDPDSNRLQKSSVGNQNTPYTYDPNGNQKNLEGLAAIAWNYRDNLQNVTLIKRDKNSDQEYYVYNSSGQRLRKVTERYANNGQTLHLSETIYLGGFEIHRQKTSSNGAEPQTTSEWHHLRLMDDQSHVATWRYWVTGELHDGAKKFQIRYQLENHLGSSVLELDYEAQLITYEEYYPYGGTALLAGTSQIEIKHKQYRYSGKEKDAATGLYYYGARYYCTWLARWLSPDPAGTIDGLNLYAFVSGNPVTYTDIGGLCGDKKEERPKRGVKRVNYNEKKGDEILNEYLKKNNEYTIEELEENEKKRKKLQEEQKIGLEERISKQKIDPLQKDIRATGKTILEKNYKKLDKLSGETISIKSGSDWSLLTNVVTSMESHENLTFYVDVGGNKFTFTKVQESNPKEGKTNISFQGAGKYTQLAKTLDDSKVGKQTLAKAVRKVLKGKVDLPKEITEKSELKAVYQLGTLLATSEFFRSVSGPVLGYLGLSYIKHDEKKKATFTEVFGNDALWPGTGSSGNAQALRDFQAGLNIKGVSTLAKAFENHIKNKNKYENFSHALNEKIVKKFQSCKRGQLNVN